MATTVNNSTLTTSTTDRIILNGVTYGSTTSVNSTNSDEVYNRIMTIPAYAVDNQGNMTQDFVSIVSGVLRSLRRSQELWKQDRRSGYQVAQGKIK